MVDGKDMEEIVRLATKVAFGMFKELSSDKPEYISRARAKEKYGKLLPIWERKGLVKPIGTGGGKYDKFPVHRLVELYEIYVTGR